MMRISLIGILLLLAFLFVAAFVIGYNASGQSLTHAGTEQTFCDGREDAQSS
jgi:hypothetical protein